MESIKVGGRTLVALAAVGMMGALSALLASNAVAQGCCGAGGASDQGHAACAAPATPAPEPKSAPAPATDAKSAPAKPQTTCPVMSGKISRKFFADYQGKRVYFCCGMCLPEFKKDPAKYIKKLEDAGVTPEPAPAAK
jgi:YHS domain-containing protein